MTHYLQVYVMLPTNYGIEIIFFLGTFVHVRKPLVARR